MIELPNHSFFIACQFHPEFQSRPSTPHPLFKGLIEAALKKMDDSSSNSNPSLLDVPNFPTSEEVTTLHHNEIISIPQS
jgi:CTP synthase